MITTHRLAAALAAFAMAACAHANTATTHTTRTPSYLGGRAGQPGSWDPSAQASVIESARRQAWNDPQLGGRSAQPASWIASDMPAPTSAAPAYCYAGGRDAQPFSGPGLLLSKPADSADAPLCERGSARPTRL